LGDSDYQINVPSFAVSVRETGVLGVSRAACNGNADHGDEGRWTEISSGFLLLRYEAGEAKRREWQLPLCNERLGRTAKVSAGWD
jgi:hypothetical protein